MYTIASSGMLRMLEVMDSLGADTGAFWQETDLTAEQLDSPHGRLPQRLLISFMEQAAQALDDPDLGLKLYEQADPGNLEIVGYAMMSSPNLRRALEQLARFGPLLDSGSILKARNESAGYRLTYRMRGGQPAPRLLGDAALAAIVGLCRRLLGDEQLKLHEARFIYARPADTQVHETIFNCPLRFGASEYSILIDHEELDQPLKSADPILEKLHVNLARERLAALRESALVRRVRASIIKAFANGPPRIDGIAESLGMSKRTLQRSLEREGVLFKDLLDDTRRRKARLHLRNSEVKLQEVGYLLGFREQSSFYRACARWFGTTPGQYRAAELAEATDRA